MTALAWSVAGVATAAAAAVLVVRARRPAALLPVADATSFGAAARRTLVLWGSLAGGLIVLLLAFAFQARARPVGAAILPPGTSGVIVIDLSGSTRASSKRIAAALLGLTGDGRRLGLVVFSDTAYEALPLSTPAGSLRDWLEVLAHDPAKSYPWTPSFSGGTLISNGLVVARRMLRHDGVAAGHVLLVSDLVDGPSDLPNLQSVLAQYQREGIALSVIKVGAPVGSASPLSFLQAPNADFVEHAAVTTIDPTRLPRAHTDPTVLLALLAAFGLVVAAYELVLHPLRWRAP